MGKRDRKQWEKLNWDWEHLMKMNCIARRPALTLEDTAKKSESSKEAKPEKMIGNYQQLCFELQQRWEVYTVRVIATVIGVLEELKN